MVRLSLIALVVAAGEQRCADAFYLPGVAPRNFAQGEKVDLKVNSLTSTRTHLPYDYYSHGEFCKPVDGVKMAAENLGEFLSGDRIENSPYELKMRTDEYCKLLCQVTFGAREAQFLRRRVREEYYHNWIIDNLPAASVVGNGQYTTTIYSRGFPIGCAQRARYGRVSTPARDPRARILQRSSSSSPPSASLPPRRLRGAAGTRSTRSRTSRSKRRRATPASSSRRPVTCERIPPPRAPPPPPHAPPPSSPPPSSLCGRRGVRGGARGPTDDLPRGCAQGW